MNRLLYGLTLTALSIHLLCPLHASAQEMEIVINADDAYELWVNGSYIGADSQWDLAQRYVVPVVDGRNLIAVYCRNRGSGARGLLLEVMVDGELVLSSGPSWRSSANEMQGWWESDFDDGGWSGIEDYGQYGIPPWRQEIRQFPADSEAHWIWGTGPGQETYLRGSFNFELPVFPPTIATFAPDSGRVGSLIKVFGGGFDSLMVVSFGEIQADSIFRESDTLVSVVVPDKAKDSFIIVTNKYGRATSPAEFRVLPDASIELVQPNGDEFWFAGTSRTVQWNWEGEIDSVTLEYSRDLGQSWINIISRYQNEGQYDWTLPQISSDSLLLRIFSAATGSPVDTSDGFFTISMPYVELLYPDGGEDFVRNSVQNIRWATYGRIDTVSLFWSADTGNTWSSIVERIANIGNYAWTVPDTVTNSTLVQVSDFDSLGTSDSSDTTFAIVDPSIDIDLPRGGEIFPGLSTWDIRWTTEGYIPFVKLEYSIDGGVSWITIVPEWPNQDYFRWTVENAASTTALVRISNPFKEQHYTQSDSFFTIIENIGDWPEYEENPYRIPVPEAVRDEQFFVIDLNGDELLDFTFRSKQRLYAVDHFGTIMWNSIIAGPNGNVGVKHAATDIEGDGFAEILALDSLGHVMVYDGIGGTVKRIIALPAIGVNNQWTHIAVVDLRGNGNRDMVVQTNHLDTLTQEFYVNRNLLAWDLENNRELWRVEQDADISNGIYEGYWGLAHGPFQAADVDGDGLDEVVGGNLVDNDGTVIDLGYPRDWVGSSGSGFVDHFDCLILGDFRPDLPGVEWIITEEDHAGNSDWHTTMMSAHGIIWREETQLFTIKDQEPQNVAAGNLDTTKPFNEVWVRSRFSGPVDSQHPWVFDAFGNEIAHYAMNEALPAGFSSHEYGNNQGIEMISVIDWDGSEKSYLLAKARHVNGNIGVFDALDGSTLWQTAEDTSRTQATLVYAADIAGDSREEIISYDAGGEIRVYANPDPNPYPQKQRKWQFPLYGRYKQNWNYYSPSGFIYEEKDEDFALRFTAPEGGETVSPGITLQARWLTAGDLGKVAISYSLDNGTNWTTIDSNLVNSGSFGWTIPDSILGECILRVANAAGGLPADTSEIFTIASALGDMEITLTVDDEYDLWVNGQYIGGNDQWNQAQEFAVPILPGNNIIAIQGNNRGGGAKGLIAEAVFNENILLRTNRTWKYWPNEIPGWWEFEFDDSNWLPVNELGVYGSDPWRMEIQGFPQNSLATWIWGDEKTDYFRASFKITDQGVVTILETDVEESGFHSTPEKNALQQNYPNPFNSSTQIRFELARGGRVSIQVYDLLGRVIDTLHDGQLGIGHHILTWNAIDVYGNALPSGLYLCRIRSGNFMEIRKMILMR